MKKIILICTLFTFLSIGLKGQQHIFDKIITYPVMGSYTVLAENDTSYAKEIVIDLSDTTLFDNMQVNLYEQTVSGFQLIASQILNKPAADAFSCDTAICSYRRNVSQWVILLGQYSLLKHYRIELAFTSSSGFQPSNNTWNDEF